jgi:hypothetical protein
VKHVAEVDNRDVSPQSYPQIVWSMRSAFG